MRAQATIEYVIILAFAMILAVAAISTLGGIPGIGGSTQSDIEKVYWSQSAEIGIPESRVALDGSMSMTIENRKGEIIKITGLTLEHWSGNYTISAAAGKILNPLEKTTVSGTVATGEPGWEYLFNVTFKYELVEHDLGTFTFKGDKPLKGKYE
jgi:hypothetical protein